ncbi:MAG: HTH domain-containing protein [Selenomonadaceae bacterium]|nr:HTH domain-containing protein [Selenomonadaceae bacterium]
MFTERQIKILKILKDNKIGVVADEIAKLCGVSSRTVRTDMKNMIFEIDKSVAEIFVSKRDGYRLEIHDSIKAQKH